MDGKWEKKLDFDRSTAVIIKDGEVLLFHRFRDGREYWAFPGGSIEEGETPEEAVDREIFEELNLRIINKRFLFKVKNQGREEYNYLIEKYEGKPKLGAEFGVHDENNYAIIDWVKLNQIEKMKELYPRVAREILVNMYKQKEI